MTDTYTDAARKLADMYADDSAHQHSHEGDVFLMTSLIPTLADSNSYFFLIDPSGISSPIGAIVEKVNLSLEMESVIYIYKDPSLSANGTECAQVNANMNSTKTADLKIYKAPTITSNGTQIHDGIYLPGKTSAGGWGGGTSGEGALNSIFTERILSSSHKMLLEIKNVSGASMSYGTLLYRHREEVP